MITKLTSLPQFKRNAARFREILAILGKHGLAEWLKESDPEFIKGLFRSAEGEKLAGMPQEVRIRLALTELGTTFIKLGQMLSTRADIVGPGIAKELSKLQADTPADPPDLVRRTLEEELGVPVEELYAGFEETAVASASIGQVHNAELEDGTPVVVKVQHPGIEKTVVNDLDILMALADVAERISSEARLYQPKATAAEFRRNLLRELDFKREERNLLQFARNFGGDGTVHFPLPFPELSTRRVLTMERVDGIPISDTGRIDVVGVNKEELAKRGANLYLEMIFRDGFYHADPHPGNILVLPGGVIGLLDCGMVGRLDVQTRDNFEGLVQALVEKDTDKLVDYILRMGSTPRDLDGNAFRADLNDLVGEYFGQSLKDIDVAAALNALTDLIRTYRIILQPSISLLIKVLIMLEGTSRLLNPSFNIIEVLQPYYVELMKRRFSPDKLLRRVQKSWRDWERLIDMFPRETAEILQNVRSGRFDVNLKHRRLDLLINRLVEGVLTAALFLGSAQILTSAIPPLFRGVSLPGAAGCLAAVLMAARLFRSMARKGGI
jgi:ubiquinone biosynthesis protein